MKKIILASSSKQRQDIFKMIGLKYDVLVSDVEEDSCLEDPSKYVAELSLNKANSVKEKVTDKAIIIGCDTIIWANDKKYEKPKTKEEAINNLKELSGKVNTAYTGVTIIDLYQDKTISFSTKVDVHFRKITDEEIEWYVNKEEKVFKCCGYVPLGKASLFIDQVVGDYNTLLGLSPNVIFDTLKELGDSVNDFEFE